MLKVVMIVTLMLKVPIAVLVFLLTNVMRNIAHLLGCFINLFLELRKPKHLFFVIFDLLVDGFEVVDLLIELILWCRVDNLPLLVPCFSKKCLFSLVTSSPWLGSRGVRTAPVVVVFFGSMMKLLVVVVNSPEVGANVGHLFLIPPGYPKQGK
jgi:hypothetical protein